MAIKNRRDGSELTLKILQREFNVPGSDREITACKSCPSVVPQAIKSYSVKFSKKFEEDYDPWKEAVESFLQEFFEVPKGKHQVLVCWNTLSFVVTVF